MFNCSSRVFNCSSRTIKYSSYYLFLQYLTRHAPKSESLLLRPHEYRREVQKATNDRSQLEKSIEESGESAPPPLVCAPLRGQVRSTRRAIARRVAVPNAKPDAKKRTRARYFLGRCAGTGKPAASASRARYKSPPEAFLPPSQPPSPVPPDIDFGASEAHHGHYLSVLNY